jgi:hypothetical protein
MMKINYCGWDVSSFDEEFPTFRRISVFVIKPPNKSKLSKLRELHVPRKIRNFGKTAVSNQNLVSFEWSFLLLRYEVGQQVLRAVVGVIC